MAAEAYPCKCGGTLRFNYEAKNRMGAWQCDRCDLETSHVRVGYGGKIHSNTFLPEYGAGKQRDRKGGLVETSQAVTKR